MPVSRLVLILVVVIAAAGFTLWGLAVLAAGTVLPGWAALAAIPLALSVYLLLRVVAEQRRDPDNGRYDRVER